METLEDDEEHSKGIDDGSLQKPKTSLPEVIIEDILLRLPVKSILRFKSVCKPWRSLTSTSSFTNLHSTVGPRTTAFFFSVYDSSTTTRYFFSGAGSVANLIELHNACLTLGLTQQVNGLVCFTFRTIRCGNIYTHVLNPSTRNFFKLPDPVPFVDEDKDTCYLFGFDELRNEHKVLYTDVGLVKPTTIELMIFSISSYSWRKIIVDLPVGMSRDRWFFRIGDSVCVNSTIHLLLRDPLQILAFDLTTETFSTVDIPLEAAALYPFRQFIKISGLLGVACHALWSVEETNKVHIWILQDYKNRVWVKETVTFPSKSQTRYGGGGPFVFDSINTDEIIFTPRMLSEDLISVLIYNIKSRCFKSIELTLDHRFQRPKSVHVEHINCYVESLIPLQN